MRTSLIRILAIVSLTWQPIAAMAIDRPSATQIDSSPSNTLIVKGLRIPKVGHTNASSQLRKFKPIKLSKGKLALYLGRNDMRKIIREILN
jgi:ribosomal protein L6P/L9E